MERLTYAPDFDQAWKAYGVVPNASKVEAAKIYDKLKRDKVLPAELITAIVAYRTWLSDVSHRQGKPFPQCHMATWLRQRRWESFLPAATEPQQGLLGEATGPSVSSWPAEVRAKILGSGRLSEAQWAVFFEPCQFMPGSPPKITSPKPFIKDSLEGRFRGIIDRYIGPDTVVS